MAWDVEGRTVEAVYYGQHVKGVVEHSRVKYGGCVQHTLKLEQPVKLRWRTELVDRVLVDDSELIG